jgi:membrane-bound ClpP family serine protease
MATLVLIYLFCLVFGLAYAIISALLGGHGGEVHGVDIGSHDIGHELSQGEVTFSPFSPIVIASFIAAFGAGGLIAYYAFHIAGFFNVLIALLSGIVVGACVFYFFYNVFKVTQSSSEARVADLKGLTAEVITPIAANGLGEVAYVLRGSRYTSPAQSADNSAIARNKTVKIQRIVGSTVIVEILDETTTASSPETDNHGE